MVLVDERSVATPGSQAPFDMALVGARGRRGALLLVGACLALAALTLLAPSAPTYDPWSWIIWGREIAHLDLVTTDGPSWKPLPVMFTTVFSVFGPASPDLWLVVARAGALAALVLAFRVARGLGGGVVGGVAAAVALGIAPWWIRTAALGNSEGLIVAFLLGAVDRELAHDRRAAFALAVCAGLLRPEAWPFLALYGLFLIWRGALPARVVLGAGVAVLALWVLPEWWGSGDLLRAAHRAKNVNAGAPTYADDPALALLRNAQAMLTGPLLVALAAAGALLVARRSRAIGVLALMAIGWLGLVAYMTQDGFSGNQRYLMPPVALAIVLAGAGAGWVVQGALSAVRARGALRGRAGRVVGVAVVAVVAGAFALPSVNRLAPTLRDLGYQAHLADDLGPLVARAGGAAALRDCGHAYTGPFLVPVVAWTLRRHINDVDLAPERPAVVFRVRTTSGSRPVPALGDVGPGRTAATAARWRIVTACTAGVST